MRCKTVGRLMTDYVDGLLGDRKGRSVREHNARCDTCRTAEEEARLVLPALEAWEDVPPPEDALARIETRIAIAPEPLPAGPAPGKVLRFTLAYGAGFATAASVLVAAWALWLRPETVPAAPSGGTAESALVTEADPDLLPGEVPLHVVDPEDGGLRVIDWPEIRRTLTPEQIERLRGRSPIVPVDYQGD